tara:strand:+ start:150 stop:428 length:279 start_codon:yes stop_codon:yes gene_type:complete
MSSIEIDPIIELSCLEITPKNKSAFKHQLEDILEYMSVINQVDHEPNSDFQWPINKDVLVRKDESVEFSHELVSENAPEFRDGCFVVPKILN